MAQGVVIGGLNSGGGSNIKSIQRGLGNTGVPITIASVDISKAVCIVSFLGATTDPPSTRVFKIAITNPTTVTVDANAGAGYGFAWTVIEFNNVKSLQSGSLLLDVNAGETVTVASVTLNKSLLFFSYTNTSTSTTEGNADSLVQGYIQNATTLNFKAFRPLTYPFTIQYYLIEFN